MRDLHTVYICVHKLMQVENGLKAVSNAQNTVDEEMKEMLRTGY